MWNVCLALKTKLLGAPVYCCRECKLVQPLCKTSMKVPQKLKIELSYNPIISLLGTYQKETKTLTWYDIRTPTFMAAFFVVAKTWKQSKCPLTDKWINKMWYTRGGMVVVEWNIQPWKRRKSCYLQQHGWTLRELC